MALPEPSFESLSVAAGEVSRETFDRMLVFIDRFKSWNQNINLVAASTLSDLWGRHVLDSAQLARLAPSAKEWVDIGSGGGFPGLVMAILLKARPGASITLIESNRKKAAFLQSIIGEMELPARVLAQRLDHAASKVASPEVVTARALASLNALLDMTAPWLEASGRALFHKGRDYRLEIAESAAHWHYDLLEHPSLTDPEARVLEISGLRRR